MTYRTTTKLYVFQQNNTFGTFDAGVGHTVLAEALTREEACARAQTVGVYFNGCATGRDCDCCGNRWEEPWDTPLPFVRPLGIDTLEEYLPRFSERNLRVVYADGGQDFYSRGGDGTIRRLQPSRGTTPGGVPIAPADAFSLPGDDPMPEEPAAGFNKGNA